MKRLESFSFFIVDLWKIFRGMQEASSLQLTSVVSHLFTFS